MKKQIFGLIAILIAFAASSFTTVKASNQRSPDLYWYTIDYSSNPAGQVDNSSDLYAHAMKADVTSPCNSGTNKDCLRGFTNQITSFPDAAPGADDIQKP